MGAAYPDALQVGQQSSRPNQLGHADDAAVRLHLVGYAQRPVVDRTGLEGNFSAVVTYTPDSGRLTGGGSAGDRSERRLDLHSAAGTGWFAPRVDARACRDPCDRPHRTPDGRLTAKLGSRLLSRIRSSETPL